MRFQAVTQIILIIISIVVIFTIIRPALTNIGENQEELARYEEAYVMATEFNAKLAALQAQANEFSASERNALETYMPETLSALDVSRDIATIAEQNNLLIESLTQENADGSGVIQEREMVGEAQFDDPMMMDSEFGSGSILEQEAARSLERGRFELTAVGTYEQVKQTMIDLERNAYPLRLITFELTPLESNSPLYTVIMKIETYALNYSS